MKFERIANLDTLCFRQNAEYNVILLHGYGADFQDLAGLHQVIPTTQPVNWFFPNAPLETKIAPMMTGRAWFPIDMAALETALARGEARYFADKIPTGLTQSAEKLYEFLMGGNFDLSKTIMGGFSQGAMVASHTVLSHDLAIPLLLQLSGTMVGHQLFNRTESSSHMKVFQSHGTHDPILPFEAAIALKTCLEQLCGEVAFESFPGGHEIPTTVINALGHAISETLTPRSKVF